MPEIRLQPGCEPITKLKQTNPPRQTSAHSGYLHPRIQTLSPAPPASYGIVRRPGTPVTELGIQNKYSGRAHFRKSAGRASVKLERGGAAQLLQQCEVYLHAWRNNSGPFSGWVKHKIWIHTCVCVHGR